MARGGPAGRAPVLALALTLTLLTTVTDGCAGRKKARPTTALPPAEAYRRAMAYLVRHKLRQAREQLEHVDYGTGPPGSREQIEPLARLALADATFYQGTILGYIDARNLYLDFVTLYGNHRLAPYAQTQVGLCSLKQVNHPLKDQTQTHQAITDLDTVIARYPASPFAAAAGDLRRRARSNLAESEFLVARFYLKRKAYVAAAERLRPLLHNYPDFPELDKIKFHLGQALVLGGNGAEGRLVLDQLLADRPEGPFAVPARRLLASLGQPGPSG